MSKCRSTAEVMIIITDSFPLRWFTLTLEIILPDLQLKIDFILLCI